MQTPTLLNGAPPIQLKLPETNTIAKVGSDFSAFIESAVNQTIQAEQSADTAIEALQSGKAKNLHEVMIMHEKADISLKMLVQFRNKALQAYEEVMRMQI